MVMQQKFVMFIHFFFPADRVSEQLQADRFEKLGKTNIFKKKNKQKTT